MDKQHLKPVVCIMNPDDIYWMKEHSNISKYMDNLLTPYEALELKNQGVVFPTFRDNVIYMLNPLEDNTYIERTESTDADIVEKRINAIEVIISHLGGKHFKAISNRKTIKGKDKQVGVNLKVNTPKVDVASKTDVYTQAASTETKDIFVSADFEGEYSEKSYNIAVATAKQYGLDNDGEIKKLLIERHPNHCNTLRRKKYIVNTCRDIKDNLKVAEDLQVGVMKAINVGVEANVKTSSDEHYTENFEFEVEFGEKKHQWLGWVIGGVVVALAAGLAIALL